MSLPNFPDNVTMTQEEALNLLLASIAYEELGLAHILNAEGEKIQTIGDLIDAGIVVTIDDMINVDNSVAKMIKTVANKEMLLQFKLEDIIEIITRYPRLIHLNIATATGEYNGELFTDSDPAYYYTIPETNAAPAISQQPVPKIEVNEPQEIGVQAVIGPVDLGNLTDYLFFFANGEIDANWQGASKGFVGDVAVDGEQASERTSGFVPYAGTIYTNAASLGAWQNIIDDNPGQANGVVEEDLRIQNLEADLISAIQQINALPVTPGFESVSSTSLDGLNTQNGIAETFVINVTSGLNFSTQIDITGDAGDVFILRWDEDADPTNGYQGQVKPQSGGAIVPHGGLTPANFINVAGNINSSGGGSTPPPPYPQGPRYDNGQGSLINGGSDFSGGGFFTGYWLTTGTPTDELDATGIFIGETDPLSNGIFVGGWYTLTTKFSMTSGTSGVYVAPNQEELIPEITVKKYVSPDNGATWYDAETPPGPYALVGSNVEFKYIITNTGNVDLTNITLTDDTYTLIPAPTPPATLQPGQSYEYILTGITALANQHVNQATATGDYNGITVQDTDLAHYFGIEAAIQVIKEVSPDNGVTWYDADTPIGPIVQEGTNPQFRYTITNIGYTDLTNITLSDDTYTLIPAPTPPATLAPGESYIYIFTGATWQAGQHTNVATATGVYNGFIVEDTNPANYFGASGPSIDVIKYVSVDNGVTWIDANNPPGPLLPNGVTPQFKIVVTNNGTVPLTNVEVYDDGTLIDTIPVLNPGDSVEYII